MKKTVLGIIATSFALYIWGFLYWGVSSMPYSSWKQTADDEQAQQVLSKHFPESGVYFVPGFDHEPEEHQDVMINLSGQIPYFFSRFDRVAEVVPVDQNSRKSARENYAYYKERGYVLNFHEIN